MALKAGSLKKYETDIAVYNRGRELGLDSATTMQRIFDKHNPAKAFTTEQKQQHMDAVYENENLTDQNIAELVVGYNWTERLFGKDLPFGVPTMGNIAADFQQALSSLMYQDVSTDVMIDGAIDIVKKQWGWTEAGGRREFIKNPPELLMGSAWSDGPWLDSRVEQAAGPENQEYVNYRLIYHERTPDNYTYQVALIPFAADNPLAGRGMLLLDDLGRPVEISVIPPVDDELQQLAPDPVQFNESIESYPNRYQEKLMEQL